jgi:hypothetical protein
METGAYPGQISVDAKSPGAVPFALSDLKPARFGDFHCLYLQCGLPESRARPLKYLSIRLRECELIHSSRPKNRADYLLCRREHPPGANRDRHSR